MATWIADTIALSAPTINGDELVRVVDDPGGTPASKKLTLNAIKAWLGIADTSLTIPTTSTPASAAATGTTGMHKWDSSYIYVCVGTNTWKRVAISTW